MTRSRLLLLALLAALLTLAAATAAFVGTAKAADPGVLYVSGFEIGRGNRALLHLTNGGSSAGDLFEVKINVFETSAGRRINALSGATNNLFQGETRTFDIGAIVKAHQASLGDGGNPKFIGPVQVVVSANGGVSGPFGPDTISVKAEQSRGKARFPTHSRWLRR